MNRSSHIIVIFLSAAVFISGCNQKSLKRTQDNIDISKDAGPSAAEGKKKTESLEDGQQEAKPQESAVDLLSVPGSIEMGIVDGGRFVDLRRISGLWILENKNQQTSWDTSKNSYGKGMPIKKHPVVLRLYEKDIGGGRVILAVDSPGELRFSWQVEEKRIRSMRLVKGTNLIAIQPPVNSNRGKIDLAVSSHCPVNSPPPSLLGAWLWRGEINPPSSPPEPETCGNGRGILLHPGEKILCAAVIPGGSKLMTAASGGGSAQIEIEIHRDGYKKIAFSLAKETQSSGKKSHASLKPLDNEFLAAGEIEVRLGHEAVEDACIESLKIIKSFPKTEKAERYAPAEGVVFVMSDTMRGDLFKWHEGYKNRDMEVTMPTLEDLASKSLRFTRATAHSSYTKPSVATMLSGLYPVEHGALGRKKALSKQVAIIMEILSLSGINSFGVLSNFFFNTKFGMNRGWKKMQWADPFKASVDDTFVLDALKKLLDSNSLTPPFFLYIHLMGAHAPYAPPVYAREQIASRLLSPSINPLSTTKLIQKFQAGSIRNISKPQLLELVGLYRSDAAHHNAIMEELLQLLDHENILDRVVFIYTSDHGEEFFEHGGLGHAQSLWSEQIDVPLLVHLPDQKVGVTLDSLVGHIDIAPTILDIFDVPKPQQMSGRSLLELVDDPKAFRNSSRGLLIQHWTGIYGVRLGKWKLLRLPNSNDRATVEKNGKEEELSPEDFPVTLRLLRKTESVLLRLSAAKMNMMDNNEAGLPAGDVQLDEETRRQLEELGYVID